MTYKNTVTKYWLLFISLAACVVSITVFSYMLVASSYSQNEALANSFTREQVITAVNKQRLSKKLPALIQNTKLNKSAQAKADDMANPEHSYFSHISPKNKKWSAFIKEADYDYNVAGENLANGYDNIEDMITAWMNSPSHRENIINKDVDETGIGIAYGKLGNKPTVFVTQHFGKLSE